MVVLYIMTFLVRFFLVWLSSINWTMLSYSGWNGSCMFYHVG